MKDVTYRLIDAYLYDYPYIERFLTNQAAKGWHLEKAGGILWKFRRGEPKNVRYEVTYSPAASAFNSRPTEAEEDLADLCAQAGWVRVATAAQLQVFRNEDPDATPLETDERERLKNIRRTMRKHLFPQYGLMVFLFLFQFAMHASNLLRWPSRTLSSSLTVFTLAMLPLVSLSYLILMTDSLLWLRRAERTVQDGQPIPANGFYRRFRWVLLAGLAAYLCSLFAMAGLTFAWAILGISAITIGCVYGIISLCKYLNAPKWVNIVVPVAVTGVVMIFLLTLFAMSMDRISLNEELPHPDTLPLMLSDLGDFGDAEHTVLEETSSPLSSYGRYWDEAGEDRISYTIVDVKCPLFYNMIQAEQEQQFLQSVSYLTDGEIAVHAEAFGAEYARRAQNDLRDRWHICWEDRIVSLTATWPLTEEQVAVVAEILKP